MNRELMMTIERILNYKPDLKRRVGRPEFKLINVVV